VAKTRPCRFCRRWFLPAPQARGHQVACARTECRRERHRVACARWRDGERDDIRGERLVEAVTAIADAATSSPAGIPPKLPGLASRRVRDAVPGEVPELIANVVKVAIQKARDAVPAEVSDITSKSAKVGVPVSRDGIAIPGPGP
jgi:hypothetical protein